MYIVIYLLLALTISYYGKRIVNLLIDILETLERIEKK
jgi:hypothetical protein